MEENDSIISSMGLQLPLVSPAKLPTSNKLLSIEPTKEEEGEDEKEEGEVEDGSSARSRGHSLKSPTTTTAVTSSSSRQENRNRSREKDRKVGGRGRDRRSRSRDHRSRSRDRRRRRSRSRERWRRKGRSRSRDRKRRSSREHASRNHLSPSKEKTKEEQKFDISKLIPSSSSGHQKSVVVELSQQLPAQPYLVEDLRESSNVNKKTTGTSKWKPVLDRGLSGIDGDKILTNIKKEEEEEEDEEPSSISNFVQKLAADQMFKLKTISPKRSRHNSLSKDSAIADKRVFTTTLPAESTTLLEEKPAIIGLTNNAFSTSSITSRKRSTSSSSSCSKPSATELHQQHDLLPYTTFMADAGINTYKQKKAEMELNAQKLLQLQLLQYQQSNAMLVQNITTLNLLSQQQILQGGSSSDLVSPNNNNNSNLVKSIGNTPSTPPQSAASSLKSPNAAFTFSSPNPNQNIPSNHHSSSSTIIKRENTSIVASNSNIKEERERLKSTDDRLKPEECKPAIVTKYHGFIRKLEKSNMTSEELKAKLKKHQRKLASEEVKRLRALISHRLKAEEAKLKSSIEVLQNEVRAKEEAELVADSKRLLREVPVPAALKEKPKLKRSPLAEDGTTSTKLEEDTALQAVSDPRRAATTPVSSGVIKTESPAAIDDYLGVLSPPGSGDQLKKKLVLSPHFTPRRIMVKSLTTTLGTPKSPQKDLVQTPDTRTNIKTSKITNIDVDNSSVLKSQTDNSSHNQNRPSMSKPPQQTSPPSILDLLPPPPPPPTFLPQSQRAIESIKRPATSPLVSPSSSPASSPSLSFWQQQHRADGKRLSLSEYHKRKPKGSDTMMETEYLAFLESIGDEPATNNNNKIKTEPKCETISPSSLPHGKEEPMVHSPPQSLNFPSMTNKFTTSTSYLSSPPPIAKTGSLYSSSSMLASTTSTVTSSTTRTPTPTSNKPKSILVTSKSFTQKSPQPVDGTPEPARKHVRIVEESPSKTAKNILSLLGPKKDSIKKNLSMSQPVNKRTNTTGYGESSSKTSSLITGVTSSEKQLQLQSKKKKGFLCGECSRSFVSFVDLEIHVNERHTDIQTINKIDVNPHNSIRVTKQVQHAKKVLTAAPTVQFTKIKKTPVLENPDKVRVHYSAKKSANDSAALKHSSKSSHKSKKLSDADIKQELARIRELREKQRKSTADNASQEQKKKSGVQNGEVAKDSLSSKQKHNGESSKDKKLKYITKEQLKEREWRIEQKRLKKKKRKEKERAFKLKQLMDAKMKEGTKTKNQQKSTKKEKGDGSGAEKTIKDSSSASSASQVSVSEVAASQQDETLEVENDMTIVVGKRQSKQTQRKKAFMEALKARQSRRKQMQEFVLSDNNETTSTTAAGSSKMKPVKTSGMIKAKEVIMKSKKVKRDLHQQLELSSKQHQHGLPQTQHPKRVALHQKVESVFKVSSGNSKSHITSSSPEEIKEPTGDMASSRINNSTNEVSFKNTTLSEDALEIIFNRVKSFKEHRASNVSQVDTPQLTTSPLPSSRKASLSDDDDPEVRALRKQIGKAERAVRVLIRNQRKDDTVDHGNLIGGNKSRRNSSDHHGGDDTEAVGGTLKVKLHIKMADFHSEATALMPLSSENGDPLTTEDAARRIDGHPNERKEEQIVESNDKSKRNNNRGNKNRRRKGALTSRKRRTKDDSTTTTASTNPSTTQQQEAQPKPSATTSRRKRSKYYVYEDELYAATQQKKPLYDASSLGSSASVAPDLASYSSDAVDFTMISSEVDFDSEFDYDLHPGEEVYLTADDILCSLLSLAEDSLSKEAAREMEKARQEQLSKVARQCLDCMLDCVCDASDETVVEDVVHVLLDDVIKLSPSVRPQFDVFSKGFKKKSTLVTNQMKKDAKADKDDITENRKTQVSELMDSLIHQIEQQQQNAIEEEPVQSPRAIISKPSTVFNLSTNDQAVHRGSTSTTIKPFVAIDLEDQMDILVTRTSTNLSPKEVDITINGWDVVREKDNVFDIDNIGPEKVNLKNDNPTETIKPKNDKVNIVSILKEDQSNDKKQGLVDEQGIDICTKVTAEEKEVMDTMDTEDTESPIERRNRLSRLKNVFYISTLCALKEEPLVDEFTEVDVQIVDEEDGTTVVESFISDVNSLNSRKGVQSFNKKIAPNTTPERQGLPTSNICGDSLLAFKAPLPNNSAASPFATPPPQVEANEVRAKVQKHYSCDRDLLTSFDYMPAQELIENNQVKEPSTEVTDYNRREGKQCEPLQNMDSVISKVCDVSTATAAAKVNRAEPMVTNTSNAPSSSSFFKCGECSLYYKSKESFHFHMKSTHSETAILNGDNDNYETKQQHSQRYSCKHCKALFTSSKRLLRHVTFKHRASCSVDGTKCTICGHTFLKQFYLKSHIRLCHSPMYDKKDKKPKTIFSS